MKTDTMEHVGECGIAGQGAGQGAGQVGKCGIEVTFEGSPLTEPCCLAPDHDGRCRPSEEGRRRAIEAMRRPPLLIEPVGARGDALWAVWAGVLWQVDSTPGGWRKRLGMVRLDGLGGRVLTHAETVNALMLVGFMP